MEKLTSRAPLSHTDLWEKISAFYHKEGISAWSSQVPFYITSNPYLANAYAQVIIRFIQDINNASPQQKDQPIYVFELGSGSGMFSFYLLKSLFELQNYWFNFKEKFIYIMSDLVEKNLDFSKNNSSFKPFIESGMLEFAFFNAESSDEILLNGKRISLLGKPLVVIANYIFDSLSVDAFQINEHGIKELQIKTKIGAQALASESLSFTLEELDKDAYFAPIAFPRFSDSLIDQVLNHYQEQKIETTMLFPTGAISCLERLRKLSSRMMVLVADKASIEPVHDYLPGFAIHGGCFSSTVDLHAISIYAAKTGGEAFHHPAESLTLSAFFIGQNLSGYLETRRALAQSLAIVNPIQLYEIFGYFSATKSLINIEALLALLKLTAWDPVVFGQFFDVVMANLEYASPSSIEQLADHAHLIAKNIYYFPGVPDTYSLLGNFFQEIRRYEEAILYYQKSVDIFGASSNVLYNMGLCNYHINEKELAVTFMRKVLTVDSGYILAKGWIVQLEESLS